MLLRRLSLLTLAASLLTGCAEISLQTVHTQERVLGRTERVVPGSGVRVRARLDGTRLVLQTTRGCERVAWERVEILEVHEADEDLTEEAVVLVLAAIPLGIGVGLLVDAPHVYDDERNSPTYNATGQTGAYAAGTVLTSIGGLMALGPIVELFRVAAAGEETIRTEERRGEVKSGNVACPGESDPMRTSVVLEAGSERIATPGTDEQGHLELDLARAISPDVAERAVTVRVIVSGKIVGELDIQPIVDKQRQLERDAEEETWLEANPERCRASSEAEACLGVRTYLLKFPDGAHAEEARQLLEARAADDEKAVIATEPVDTKTQQAIDRARAARDRACAAECQRNCARDAACAASCEEICR